MSEVIGSYCTNCKSFFGIVGLESCPFCRSLNMKPVKV